MTSDLEVTVMRVLRNESESFLVSVDEEFSKYKETGEWTISKNISVGEELYPAVSVGPDGQVDYEGCGKKEISPENEPLTISEKGSKFIVRVKVPIDIYQKTKEELEGIAKKYSDDTFTIQLKIEEFEEFIQEKPEASG